GVSVTAMGTEGATEAARLADHVIEVPETPELLSPVVVTVPLQLLAYHVAVLRGRDVDRPRNLAKSLTVEWAGGTGRAPADRGRGRGPARGVRRRTRGRM